jgi:CRP-like cAMP-binding protein
MFAIFRNYLKSKADFSDEDLGKIEAVCIFKKLRKRQYLLQEGDVWRYIGFVCTGFVRTYSVDSKGQEHIISFAPENYWTGDRESLASGNPSVYNIDALEDSQIILINKDNFENLCRDIPLFNEMINTILHRSFVAAQSRINAAISLSAEEKYYHFLQKYTAIVDRIPQHMIASYLGISAETLSRIRSQAAKK